MHHDSGDNGERPHSNGGGVPLTVDRVDTGRLEKALHAELHQANVGGIGVKDDILNQLADKIEERRRSSPPPPPSTPPKKTFLGLALGNWTAYVVSLIIGAVGLLITWHFTVRDELLGVQHYIELHESAEQRHDESTRAHPPIQDRLVNIESALTKQTEILDVIKVDISNISGKLDKPRTPRRPR